jgi:GNAT superfamily N-acetyltransferase
MSSPSFAYQIVPLVAEHNRADFRCGSEPLEQYLRERANQDFKRYVATPFVLYDLETERIAGYYTLAATGIQFEDLPETMRKKLPRYPLVPAILMGRLAVDERYQGQGLGSFLLVDALRRSLMNEIVAAAVIVDAKDKTAQAFYEYHGFVSLDQQPLRLFIPMTLIDKQFRIGRKS